jgi:hypothetical protein
MNATTYADSSAVIADRVREIQSQWSPQERRRRAETGRRLRNEFIRRLIDIPAEPEIWAVGAPGDEDLQRLAG